MVKGVMANQPPVIQVALAIVRRGDRFLVGKRPTEAHLGGLWEFPGGKFELGESAADAALRELREECNVVATIDSTLPKLQHDYGDRIIELTPILCRWVSGEGEPLGTEVCRWFTLADLRALPMPAMNDAILDQVGRVIDPTFLIREAGSSGR
jgi:mutator protein MutT